MSLKRLVLAAGFVLRRAMSMNRQFLVVLAIVLGIAPASRGGLIIDSFEDVAQGNWPVTRTTSGGTTVIDPNMTGVLGAWRETRVTASIDIVGVDQVEVGISPADGILDYASSIGADAVLSLFYRGDPSEQHLHADLSDDALIRIEFSDFDNAGGIPMLVAVVFNVGVTPPDPPMLVMSLMEPGPQSLDFPFADFARIEDADLSDLENIRVSFAAGPGTDFRVDEILSVVPEPATLGLLAVGGLLVMRRRRRRFGSTGTVRGRARGGLLVPAMAVVLAVGQTCQAGYLLGGALDGTLYQVDALTGLASNPRDSGLDTLVGLAYSPVHGLYGTDAHALYRLGLAGGDPELIVAERPFLHWHDFAFDPTDRTLYGSGDFARIGRFYTVNPETGETTLITDGGIDIEGKLAFNPAGELFLLAMYRDRLNTIDKETGRVISYVDVEGTFKDFGMAFDQVGTLFLVDGGDLGTDTLYHLNTSTGELNMVGHTGLADGVTSLVYIPEPGTVALLGFVGLGVLTRRRRRGAQRRFLGAPSVLLFALTGSGAFAGIIDDKSDFVGDYTVIDFESWGNGTPLTLDEGEWIELMPDEYAPLGVEITASPNFFGNHALVGNALSEQFDTAQGEAGSMANSLFVDWIDGFVRYDFARPVNAVGISVINRSDAGSVRLEVFDASDQLIESVQFAGPLIDGTIEGAAFGNSYDFDFGFFGIFVNDEQIAYALAYEDIAYFDDLHFGVIPEPGSVALLGFVGLGVLTRRRRRGAQRRFLGAPSVLLFALTGSGVFAGIIDDKSDFVGDFTVIDFETRGDETPLILDEGEGIELPPDEYMSLAAVMSSSINLFGRYRPFVGNGMPDGQTDGAHMAVGSIPNTLFVNGRNGFLHLDFQRAVNAVGISVMNWTDGAGVRLEAYDQDDQLIEWLDFNDSLVDGVILGSDFGNLYDIEYGFFGLFTPTDDIAYVIICEDRTVFDDLYFGVIPEPGSVALLGLVGLPLLTCPRVRRARRRFVAASGVLLFALTGSGVFAGIIDDKSDFVGDFTVIDFETWGDGTPLIFGEGYGVEISPDEYAPSGVTITASFDPVSGRDNPVVGNAQSCQFDLALAAVGSLDNTVMDRRFDGFLRFDFDQPVNAVGLAVINVSGEGSVWLAVFDGAGELLESVLFDESVIDGTVAGDIFGDPHDLDYGFFGLFTPGEQIAHAIVTEDGTGFDDLHFGIIPESGSVTLLGLVGLGVLTRRRRRGLFSFDEEPAHLLERA